MVPPIIDGAQPEQEEPLLLTEEEEKEAYALRLVLESELDKCRFRARIPERFNNLEEMQAYLVHIEDDTSDEDLLCELVVLTSSYSQRILQRALVTTIGEEGEEGYTGRFPLHLACDVNAPVSIIQFLLQAEAAPHRSVLHKDKWKDLPLHTACSRQNYTEVVELLLQYDATKRSVLTPRFDGSLPLHTACRYNAPPKVIQMLLDADLSRKTLVTSSMYRQVPLHVACRCNLQTDSLQLLLDYDTSRQSVLITDEAGRLPLHVAYSYSPSWTVRGGVKTAIELILDCMLMGRIERMGLIQWKDCVQQEILKPMQEASQGERNVNVTYHLQITCQLLQTYLMDRAAVLEEILSPLQCSHEMIVPGVLSFLEDEPISQILQEFRRSF